MRVRSGLGRPIDWSYPSNRFVMVLAPVAGVVAGVWRLGLGDGWSRSAWGGFVAGGAVFLAWAIARELDPPSPVTAGAAAVAAPWAVPAGDPALLGVAIILLASRAVAGTTGYRIYSTDAFALVLVAGWSATGRAGPGPAVVAAVAVAFGDRRLGLVAAPLMVAAATAAWSLWGSGPEFAAMTPQTWALAGVGALAVPGLVWSRAGIPTDRGDRLVTTGQVRAARVTALAAGAAAGAWFGSDGVIAVSPVLVALGVTALRVPGRQ